VTQSISATTWDIGLVLKHQIIHRKPYIRSPIVIGCGNCDVSGGHWTRSQRRRSSMPSSHRTSSTVMYCWWAHQRLRLTSYSVCWMRQHVFLVTRASLITVWCSLCMLTCIGSTCRSELSLNSCRWSITASITRLPSTWRTAAFPSLMWPVDGIFVLLGVITLLYRDSLSVGHLQLLARLPGTHRVMICAIWRLALTVSDVCLRLICSQSTSTYSASEVSHFMCYTNLRLTYLLNNTCSHVSDDVMWLKSCPQNLWGFISW